MMDAETVIKLFNERKSKYNIPYDLKKEQADVAVSIANKRNCVAFLPTGYGKTLCFMVNAIIHDIPCLTLVVSPLLSLMDSQIKSLKACNFTCIKIGSDLTAEESDGMIFGLNYFIKNRIYTYLLCCKQIIKLMIFTGISTGEYSFVFSSPESVLKQKWRDIFLNDIWQSRIALIVFDEAHCISEWGEEFRPEYQEMSQLRSFFKAPVLSLTATCTPKIKEEIMTSLQLDECNTDIICKSANRENIFIICRKKLTREYEVELDWLVNHLKERGKNSKKSIVYCRSIDTVSEVFITVKRLLGDQAYSDGIKCSQNLLVEMYHKCTHETSKNRILTDFSSNLSTIRCLFATVALGMGIDIPDVDIVVHIGCPKSVISYWQEAGRCARDGRQGLSYIMYDNFTASLKNTDKSMASMVRSSETDCIRKQVLSTFSISEAHSYISTVCEGCDFKYCNCQACRCCEICAQRCPCSKRSILDLDTFLSNVDFNARLTSEKN
ncbi:uncharacterized protein LOC132719355 [Ruditapes philippinarum]|uniref:uncharacterized protein LOC132719355 n=1 Tax=Ruditapes philippinarum TaxID=129788 RepID=UPI00295BD09A|nr:uncharacterized protein LOC132719355 [Ruditapes philippinarum]